MGRYDDQWATQERLRKINQAALERTRNAAPVDPAAYRQKLAAGGDPARLPPNGSQPPRGAAPSVDPKAAELRQRIGSGAQPASLPKSVQSIGGEPIRATGGVKGVAGRAFQAGERAAEAAKSYATRIPAVSGKGVLSGIGAAAKRLLGPAAIVAPVVANADVLGSRSPLDVTDKAKVVGKSIGQGAGGFVGGAMGAGAGSALAGPVGTVAGGIGGYFAGDKLIDAAGGAIRKGANYVNEALGGAPNYFESVDDKIEHARNLMAPYNFPMRSESYAEQPFADAATTPPPAAPVATNAQSIAAGYGDRAVPRPARPRAPVAPRSSATADNTVGRLQAQAANELEAPLPAQVAPAVVAAPEAPAPAAPVIGASGVMNARFGSTPDQFAAQLADGTWVQGAQAMPLVNQYLAEQAAQPQTQEQRAMTQTPIRSMNGNVVGTQVAYGEEAGREANRAEALSQAPSSIVAGPPEVRAQWIGDMQTGARDRADPIGAEISKDAAAVRARGAEALKLQRELIDGNLTQAQFEIASRELIARERDATSIKTAGIGAGATLGAAAMQRDSANARLAHEQKIGRWKTERVGTEMQDNGFGQMVPVPIYGRFDSITGEPWKDPNAPAPGTNPDIPPTAIAKLRANPALAEAFDKKYGKGAAASVGVR